jgi:propionyl-CoA carboxylase alpha chain
MFKTFKKILIANRGEIACRIIRTAKRMGIKTVAVYSSADANALHVRQADESVWIGEAPAAESYLRAEVIIKAAQDTGAEAIHPGFGFLSENSAFAESLAAASITFIGPGPHAIAAMGDKIESKKLAKKAGVNTIPGHTKALDGAEEAVEIAKQIGFPVMLKATAGGGGKGMRIAYDEAGARDGFISAANEARSSFGDDRIFAEKFIEQPRHIEIQILADSHNNIVHLGERECSIQRRHQKVIEEAPSPFIDDATRAAMGQQAIELAKAVDYVSAGTVEFVVDQQRYFYFLEMNTRLQVEHPVTELVTGLDLVEQMIRIAAGEKLKFSQSDIKMTNWAIEARIYAEDPDRNFMPSTGRVITYLEPPTSAEVRVDSGVYEGGEISVYYDPMIAKLIARGENREAARLRLIDALDSYCIRGVSHNIPFLAATLLQERFAAGNITTAFIDEQFPDGFSRAKVEHSDPNLLVAIAACLNQIVDARALNGRQATASHNHYSVLIDGREVSTAVEVSGNGFSVALDDTSYQVELDWRIGENIVCGSANASPFVMQTEQGDFSWFLTHRGYQAELRVMSARAAQLQRLMPVKRAPDLSKFLLSPMPGLLVRLCVAAGDRVKAGQELAVIEAMKMENSLSAARDGTVAIVLAEQNEILSVDQAILEFE